MNWSVTLLERANWSVWAHVDSDQETARVMVSVNPDATVVWTELWDYDDFVAAHDGDAEGLALAVANRCWPNPATACLAESLELVPHFSLVSN